MAYTHSKYEVDLGRYNLVTAGELKWAPGYVPHILRAVSFVVDATAASGSATGVISIIKQVTAGSATGEVVAATLTVVPVGSATLALGKVVYKDGLNVSIAPGQSIRTSLTTVSTAGGGSLILYLEPTWETPANDSAMVATT